MRFNKRAKIIYRANKPIYNPNTGRVTQSQSEEIVPCASSVLSDDLLLRMLGTVEVNAQVLAFNRTFQLPIAEVEFDSKRFAPFQKKVLGNRTLIYVREVHARGNKDSRS